MNAQINAQDYFACHVSLKKVESLEDGNIHINIKLIAKKCNNLIMDLYN
jgi:hypothetical protein